MGRWRRWRKGRTLWRSGGCGVGLGRRYAAMPRELSVVIPVFDEQDNLQSLHGRLTQTLGALGKSYEVIYVDDGSRDGSFSLLRALAQRDGNVRIIRFRRNYGQTAAISAGFAHAQGAVIITMDADLQNDPDDIPRLLSALGESNDVVSGW